MIENSTIKDSKASEFETSPQNNLKPIDIIDEESELFWKDEFLPRTDTNSTDSNDDIKKLNNDLDDFIKHGAAINEKPDISTYMSNEDLNQSYISSSKPPVSENPDISIKASNDIPESCLSPSKPPVSPLSDCAIYENNHNDTIDQILFG
jgi:hypothetical protein